MPCSAVFLPAELVKVDLLALVAAEPEEPVRGEAGKYAAKGLGRQDLQDSADGHGAGYHYREHLVGGGQEHRHERPGGYEPLGKEI